MINIVIPVEKWSKQLETTVALLHKYKNDVETQLHIMEEPDINVSECRQLAMELYGPYVCFLDYDSEMMHDHWLDNMWDVMQKFPDTKAVFGVEIWGDIKHVPGNATLPNGLPINPFNKRCTPAACMLMDTRMNDTIFWDKHIGLRNGWLGGDFEEIDLCMKMHLAGYKLRICTDTRFHHTGGKKDFESFWNSDSAQSVIIMGELLQCKYCDSEESRKDDDFFKGLTYLKADPNNDNMLAPGYNIRDCYLPVCRRNGLGDLV
jgi:hypothetical protein